MKNILVILILIALLAGCEQKKSTERQTVKAPTPESEFVQMANALDTFSKAEKKKILKGYLENIDTATSKTALDFYKYFESVLWNLEGHKDKSTSILQSISGTTTETALLRNLVLFENQTKVGSVGADIVNKIQENVKIAESEKSKFLYAYYDLLARIYYQNRNLGQSLHYTEMYYNNHPFKTHPTIAQRYYDISFLLASRMRDIKKMKEFNKQARTLAIQLNDSLAISRTYDYEAQIYAAMGSPEKSLEGSRRYFQFLRSMEQLNEIAYNNLGTSFLKNKAYDSAIFYYQKGVELSRINNNVAVKVSLFNGLREAYAAQNRYAAALQAADSAALSEITNVKMIEEAKIAEVREKFAAEKKDIRINQLDHTNLLSQRVIVQQRWTMLIIGLGFVGILFTLFIYNRQRLLKNKNALLVAENKRMQTEQRMLQAQLNPHFIFNAIANLQGLIGSGERDLSMEYLSSFSKLLRNTLEQNRKDFITLEEEIASLRNYLNLQQMRFRDLFDYHIALAENIDSEDLLIPPMILQPFLENSVEHGFRNITYKGSLLISMHLENGSLRISIDDNGSGLEEIQVRERNKTSLSRIILKERMERIYKSSGQPAKFDIIDKKMYGERGVKIDIVLPALTDD